MPRSDSGDIERFKNDARSFVNRALRDLKNSSATQQLAVGSASGWLTGFVTMKIGKSIAFAVGGSIILLQIAQHKGYVSINWDKVKEKTEEAAELVENQCSNQAPGWMEQVRTYARNNSLFTGGFLGGFFIGLAS